MEKISENQKKTKIKLDEILSNIPNIPNFDGPLQHAGGSSNAFTSNDVTNYYDTLPVQNLETAFWLESDRLNKLAFTDKNRNSLSQILKLLIAVQTIVPEGMNL